MPDLDAPRLDADACATIRSTRHAGTWQSGHFYANAGVMDRERPYHLHALLMVTVDGHVFPPKVFAPTVALAQTLVDTLVEIAPKEKVLPEMIEISDRRLLKAVSPTLSSLGVKTLHKAELPACDAAAEALTQYLERTASGSRGK